MSKPFDAPLVEKIESAVKTKQEEKAIQQEEKEVTLDSVWENKVDDFILFIKGEKGLPNQEARIDYQVDFIKNVFPSLLSNPFPTSLNSLKYFVKQLRVNQAAIGMHRILEPVMGANKVLHAVEIERYQYTINLLYRAATTSDKQALIRSFDTTMLLNQWEGDARETLYHFLFD